MFSYPLNCWKYSSVGQSILDITNAADLDKSEIPNNYWILDKRSEKVFPLENLRESNSTTKTNFTDLLFFNMLLIKEALTIPFSAFVSLNPPKSYT